MRAEGVPEVPGVPEVLGSGFARVSRILSILLNLEPRTPGTPRNPRNPPEPIENLTRTPTCVTLHPDIRMEVAIFDDLTALADATRSRMLLVLERHELTVGELCG